MKLLKDIVLLDINSPTFADDFAKEIGPGPVTVMTPQFHRTDGVLVNAPDLTPDEWWNLDKVPVTRLRQMGCQVWEDDAKGIHWLFPGQWYLHIPEGLTITYISGKSDTFKRGVTDGDIRFGALAFGFITPQQEQVK